MLKLSSINLPLFIAMGGCLGFGLFSAYVSHDTTDTLVHIQRITGKMAKDSYFTGCVNAAKDVRNHYRKKMPTDSNISDACKWQAAEFATPIQRMMER